MGELPALQAVKIERRFEINEPVPLANIEWDLNAYEKALGEISLSLTLLSKFKGTSKIPEDFGNYNIMLLKENLFTTLFWNQHGPTGSAKPSNTNRIQTLQSIILRKITNAPFYVTNPNPP
jgi:hypothetical protein